MARKKFFDHLLEIRKKAKEKLITQLKNHQTPSNQATKSNFFVWMPIFFACGCIFYFSFDRSFFANYFPLATCLVASIPLIFFNRKSLLSLLFLSITLFLAGGFYAMSYDKFFFNYQRISGKAYLIGEGEIINVKKFQNPRNHLDGVTLLVAPTYLKKPQGKEVDKFHSKEIKEDAKKDRETSSDKDKKVRKRTKKHAKKGAKKKVKKTKKLHKTKANKESDGQAKPLTCDNFKAITDSDSLSSDNSSQNLEKKDSDENHSSKYNNFSQIGSALSSQENLEMADLHNAQEKCRKKTRRKKKKIKITQESSLANPSFLPLSNQDNPSYSKTQPQDEDQNLDAKAKLEKFDNEPNLRVDSFKENVINPNFSHTFVQEDLVNPGPSNFSKIDLQRSVEDYVEKNPKKHRQKKSAKNVRLAQASQKKFLESFVNIPDLTEIDRRFLDLKNSSAALIWQEIDDGYYLKNPPPLISINLSKNGDYKTNDVIRFYAYLNSPKQKEFEEEFDFEFDAKMKGIGGFGFSIGRPEIISKNQKNENWIIPNLIEDLKHFLKQNSHLVNLNLGESEENGIKTTFNDKLNLNRNTDPKIIALNIDESVFRANFLNQFFYSLRDKIEKKIRRVFEDQHRQPKSKFYQGDVLNDLKVNNDSFANSHPANALEQEFSANSSLNGFSDTVLQPDQNKGHNFDIGGVAMALLIGDQSQISQPKLDDIRNSGLAHLLSISGFHLSIASAIFFMAIRYAISRNEKITLNFNIKKIAAIFAIFASYFYLRIANSPIPAQRAFLIVFVVMLGILFDRKFHNLRALAVAFLLIVLTNPLSLFNISFQLSFSAVLMLASYYENLRPRLFPDTKLQLASGLITTFLSKARQYLIEIVFLSFLIQLASLPFLMHTFRNVAPLSFLANMMAIPLTSFVIMPLGFLGLFLMPLSLEFLALKPMGVGIDLMLKIAEFFGKFEISKLKTPHLPSEGLVIAVFGLLLFCLSRNRFGKICGFLIFIASFAAVGFQSKPALIFDGTQKFFAIYENSQDKKSGELFFSKSLRESKRNKAWLDHFDEKNFKVIRNCDKQDETETNLPKLPELAIKIGEIEIKPSQQILSKTKSKKKAGKKELGSEVLNQKEDEEKNSQNYDEALNHNGLQSKEATTNEDLQMNNEEKVEDEKFAKIPPQSHSKSCQKCNSSLCLLSFRQDEIIKKILILTKRNQVTKICSDKFLGDIDVVINMTGRFNLPDCIQRSQKILVIDNQDFLRGKNVEILPEMRLKQIH